MSSISDDLLSLEQPHYLFICYKRLPLPLLYSLGGSASLPMPSASIQITQYLSLLLYSAGGSEYSFTYAFVLAHRRELLNINIIFFCLQEDTPPVWMLMIS